MFYRKEYKVLAKNFKKELTSYPIGSLPYLALARVIKDINSDLYLMNKDFKPYIFLIACGFTKEFMESQEWVEIAKELNV